MSGWTIVVHGARAPPQSDGLRYDTLDQALHKFSELRQWCAAYGADEVEDVLVVHADSAKVEARWPVPLSPRLRRRPLPPPPSSPLPLKGITCPGVRFIVRGKDKLSCAARGFKSAKALCTHRLGVYLKTNGRYQVTSGLCYDHTGKHISTRCCKRNALRFSMGFVTDPERGKRLLANVFQRFYRMVRRWLGCTGGSADLVNDNEDALRYDKSVYAWSEEDVQAERNLEPETEYAERRMSCARTALKLFQRYKQAVLDMSATAPPLPSQRGRLLVPLPPPPTPLPPPPPPPPPPSEALGTWEAVVAACRDGSDAARLMHAIRAIKQFVVLGNDGNQGIAMLYSLAACESICTDVRAYAHASLNLLI